VTAQAASTLQLQVIFKQSMFQQGQVLASAWLFYKKKTFSSEISFNFYSYPTPKEHTQISNANSILFWERFHRFFFLAGFSSIELHYQNNDAARTNAEFWKQFWM